MKQENLCLRGKKNKAHSVVLTSQNVLLGQRVSPRGSRSLACYYCLDQFKHWEEDGLTQLCLVKERRKAGPWGLFDLSVLE